jgi:hypothetical protein
MSPQHFVPPFLIGLLAVLCIDGRLPDLPQTALPHQLLARPNKDGPDARG